MNSTTDVPDKLQALRAQVTAAATPAGRVEATLQLGEELWLSAPADAMPLLELVVTESEKTGQTSDGARAASMLSELRRRAGDLNGSARYAKLVLRAADATGDRRIRAGGLNLVGMVHQERGSYQQALECFEECLKLSRETAFEQGEQSALNQLAGTYGLRGQSSKALECYRQCLEASSKAGDVFGRAIHLHNIGWTLVSMGRWTEATEYFHRTLALCEEHGFRDLLLTARMSLGELSLKRSDYENATLMFSAVIEAERETRHSGRLLREALSNLGWTHFRGGGLAKAEETMDEAARLSETAEDRCLLASLCRRRAELALAQGRLDAARDFLAQAARHASDLDLRKEQGETLRVEALLSEARAKTDVALDLLLQSETVLEPLGDTYELALTRLQRGRLLVDLGQSDKALPLLQAAARTFRRLSVVAEAEEASRLLYRLEVSADRGSALVQGLFGISALDLAPERLVERAVSILCDNLQFDQGVVLVGGRPVVTKGQPDLAKLPKRLTSPTQTDRALFLPIRQDRRLVGQLWLRRKRPLATRVKPGLLELIGRMLAPSLLKLGELQVLETGPVPEIPGLRFRGVVGQNREVLEVLALIPRVAGAAASVLVCGESGTGKELIARALHESGPRADRPFVPVNCAAVPENLLEAEFFGVEAGAATGVAARPGKFELANGGTIFLDEIGDMSPGVQSKLLRVIEDKAVTRVGGTKAAPVDVRVIAATNMDLESRVVDGRFRRDLLYRLNTVQFVLPPLHRRCEDIPALTSFFIARTAQEYNRTARPASAEVLALFTEYPWPGNVRQLQHVIERAAIVATGDTIEVADLPIELRQTAALSVAQPVPATRTERRKAAAESERAMLLDVISRANGNVRSAIKLSGYSRTHFYRLLQKHHIKPQE